MNRVGGRRPRHRASRVALRASGRRRAASTYRCVCSCNGRLCGPSLSAAAQAQRFNRVDRRNGRRRAVQAECDQLAEFAVAMVMPWRGGLLRGFGGMPRQCAWARGLGVRMGRLAAGVVSTAAAPGVVGGSGAQRLVVRVRVRHDRVQRRQQPRRHERQDRERTRPRPVSARRRGLGCSAGQDHGGGRRGACSGVRERLAPDSDWVKGLMQLCCNISHSGCNRFAKPRP